MKKHETLFQLVNRLKLKPSEIEIEMGRSRTKNGISYVCVDVNNEYTTFRAQHFCNDDDKCYIVKG